MVEQGTLNLKVDGSSPLISTPVDLKILDGGSGYTLTTGPGLLSAYQNALCFYVGTIRRS